MSQQETTHRIRLNGPWEVHPEAAGAPTGRLMVPGTLGDGGWTDYVGRVRFRRRFGKPTGLTNERVWLVFERIAGAATVALNGQALGEIQSQGAFEVTTQLGGRNEVEVVLVAKDDQCGIVGDVVLEIRSAVH
jgi:hypothetical protein